jgi:trans-aconitate 2-methyltransferase
MTNAWDVGLYEGRHAFVWRYGAELIELLDPQPGERVLDLGAGTGHLAAAIAAKGATVTGIDASPEMVEQARSLYPGIDFRAGDAASFSVEAPFDAVFSNATLHWVKAADEAAACIARALRPGGRFVAELGGHGNVASVVEAVYAARRELGLDEGESLNPWYFPRVGEYTSLLERHGLEVTYAHHFDRPTALDGDEAGMREWLAMFASSFLSDLEGDVRETVIEGVERRLRPGSYRDGVWTVDYRRLRVVAVRV